MAHRGQKRRRGRARRVPVALSAAIILVAVVAVWVANRERASRRMIAEPVHEYPPGFVETGDANGFNVLLVTLDTVRADRLGCYGHQSAETPRLDALAKRGVRFGDAVTSVPLTLPSHATILTGLCPTSHGVHDNGRYALADRHTTLAEVLSADGYDTAAFVGCFVLDARFGLDQGFDVYDLEISSDGYRPEMPDYNERSATDVTDAAVDWLEGRSTPRVSTPFFTWVHYFDPHLPYRSPLQRLPRFAARPYDAEIAYVDAEFGRLLDALGALGLSDNTVVVVAGDHGEALGEHSEPTHGMLLYEPTMRVPLIVSCPSLFDRAYVVQDRVVGLTDVWPTVEDLLGLEGVAPTDGENLLEPATGADRAIYIETEMPLSLAGWSPLLGLRTHTHKYIEAPTPELYDLIADPNESRNVYSQGDSIIVHLESRLTQVVGSAAMGVRSARDLTDEETERLASLGYVQSAAGTRDGPLPDPKSMMSVYADALRSEQLYGQGRYSEAAELARSVLDRGGMLVHAVRVLAFSSVRLGRADEAVELLRGSTERNPDAFLIRSLAQVLILDGRLDEALDALEIYAGVDPLDGRVSILRGDIYAQRGLEGRAVSEYENAIRVDEHRVGIQARQRISRLTEDASRGPGE